MALRSYRDDALVLRTRVFSEADRVLTLLTREHGRVQALAKGVRKTSSRIGARLEPHMLVDVQCHTGRTFHYVTQVELKAAYGDPISVDYDRYTAAAVVTETVDRLLGADELAATALFRLTHGAVAALARAAYPPRLIVDSFLLRAMAISGWAMSCAECAACGAPGPHEFFHVDQGGAVCSSCRVAGSVRVSPATMALLAALLTGSWPQAVASDPAARRSASGLVAAYTQWHLAAGVRSLAMMEASSS